MSNVIKAYAVCYDKNVTKTIDSHHNWKEKEIIVKKCTPENIKDTTEGFVMGLDAVQVKETPTQEELIENSNQILEKAKLEAEKILEQAKQEATKIREEAYAEAKEKGYEDGIASSVLEVKKKKDAVNQMQVQLQEDYEAMVKELEPQIAVIISSLVEKITGVVVEHRKDVIAHLVEKALKKQEKYNAFTIRVSKEDYGFVCSKKETILDSIGRDIELKITEDVSIDKNQCLIETDYCVINCGLDQQLENLAMDIKLLGGAI